jgi:diguanylate cyclase (GGDEF)-like protein/PAS domain S-box-containing protein
VVVVDDSDDDAELIARELRRGGWQPEYRRVDKQRDLEHTLRHDPWDLVVADYSLPQLDAFATLRIVREIAPDLPCIVVSGRTGEEAAVETMQRGAQDYVVKHRLARLGPVVERALRDAHERRTQAETEESLHELELRFRAVVDSAMDAVVTVGDDGAIETFNPAAQRLFGWAADEAIGRPVTTLLADPADAVFGPDADGVHREVTGRDKSDRTFPLELSISAARLGGRPISTWIARDISDRKAVEAQLAEQALHDPLTRVANRTLLVDRIANVLSRTSRRSSAAAALLFLDLDHFKAINDTLGHAAGDEVLRVVAKRLAALVRPADTIARFGGDEFVVLCEDVTDHGGAERIAQRIADALDAPIVVGDTDVVVSASIGVAVVDDPALEVETLLRDADAAMYRAKERGRDRFEIFDHDMRRQAAVRVELEHSLRRALDDGQLRVHYQPQWSLLDGSLLGVEALLRWQHPLRGLLGPRDFLHVADDSGLLVPIGAWVVEQVCADAPHLALAGPVAPRVWLNVSARELMHRDLVRRVQTVLSRADHAVSIGIEITENALMTDPGAAVVATRQLEELGVAIAIDDFGTGYSSLSYVKLFPVDTLKVDRSFVQGVAEDLHDRAIVAAIVGLARALGLTVVAEGVETPEQAAALTRLGCTGAQGYHFAAPAPLDEIVATLAAD